MTARRSNTANAWETTLTSQMAPTDLTAVVATTTGGPATPCYLVIEPNAAGTQLEIIYFDGTFTGTTFVTSGIGNRYLTGSAAASGLTHGVGSKVRSVPVSQIVTDIFDYVDATTTTVALKAPLASPTFTGTVTLPGDPASDLVAADKRYVDINTAAKRVRAVATTNGTLSTAYANGQTVDGVTLATGDRILLAGQTSGSANGIYVVAASGAPARAGDFDTSAKALSGMLVTVSEGTTYLDTVWQLTTNAAITLDTTALVFSRVPGMVAVSKAGSAVGTRSKLNLIEGTNVTMTVADNSGSDRVDVTINAASGGSATSHVCSLTASTTQSITTATETSVAFDTEASDADGAHDPVTNNSRITIPSAWNGKTVVLVAQATYAGNATGRRLIYLKKNGTTYLAKGEGNTSGTNSLTCLTGFVIPSATTSDYYEVRAYQTSGSGLNIEGEAQDKGTTQFNAYLWT